MLYVRSMLSCARPPSWKSYKDKRSTALLQAFVGIVLPTVVLSNLQQAAFNRFVHKTTTDLTLPPVPVGASGPGLSQKEKWQ